jgi:hypothetical protein
MLAGPMSGLLGTTIGNLGDLPADLDDADSPEELSRVMAQRMVRELR